jgi:hypothetical protein
MPRFERLDFPKKYPVPNWIKLAIIVALIAGFGIYDCSQKKVLDEIKVLDVKITDYSRVHIEVQYTIQSQSHVDRDIWFILKAFDIKGKELGSTLYQVNVKAGRSQPMLKILDKLERPLENGEKPDKATVSIYTRKVI